MFFNNRVFNLQFVTFYHSSQWHGHQLSVLQTQCKYGHQFYKYFSPFVHLVALVLTSFQFQAPQCSYGSLFWLIFHTLPTAVDTFLNCFLNIFDFEQITIWRKTVISLSSGLSLYPWMTLNRKISLNLIFLCLTKFFIAFYMKAWNFESEILNEFSKNMWSLCT